MQGFILFCSHPNAILRRTGQFPVNLPATDLQRVFQGVVIPRRHGDGSCRQVGVGRYGVADLCSELHLRRGTGIVAVVVYARAGQSHPCTEVPCRVIATEIGGTEAVPFPYGPAESWVRVVFP